MENTGINKWSSAAMNGLFLSLVTVIITLLTTIVEIKSVPINIIIWVIKLAGSMWLLFYFMKQYSGNFNQISYKDSFIYGFLVCVFSSIICSCYTYLSFTVIFPGMADKITETYQLIMAQQNVSESEEAAAEKMMNKLPEIMLGGMFIYLTIIGLISSSIMANYTKKTDIFASNENDTAGMNENGENSDSSSKEQNNN
jgi:predicted membrane protein